VSFSNTLSHLFSDTFRQYEQMTSIGRFSLASESVWNPSIITVVIELRNSRNHPKFTKHDFIRLWNQRNMDERHPRFHQIVDYPTRNLSGMQEFHSSHTTDISQHVSESILPMNRQSLQKRIQDMQLNQWDLSDSLWHLTVCNSLEKSLGDAGKTNDKLSNTLLLFRGHHVLADGASMSAAFADLYDESDALRAQIADFVKAYRRRNRRSKSVLQRLWKQLLLLLHVCLGSIFSFLYMLRLFFFQIFIDDHPWRFIKKQYDSTNYTERNRENNPEVARVISWSDVASIEQVKWVADTLSQWNNDNTEKSRSETRKISVNDVFIACVTAAMTKQLDFHRQRLSRLSTSLKQIVLAKQNFIHVAVPVHLKGGVVLPDESVGNNIGALVVRVPSEMETSSIENGDCVRRLHSVNREMLAIKRSPTAILSHIMAKMLSYATAYRVLPLSWTTRIYAAFNAGSMVVISNNRGPSMPVHLDGHQVESVYGFVPLPPGVPVGVALMSYAGRISCTLSAEPWAVPDGDQFIIWVIEEYLRLVNAAKAQESLQQVKQER
jgi:WS/DGAT C-terminal domain